MVVVPYGSQISVRQVFIQFPHQVTHVTRTGNISDGIGVLDGKRRIFGRSAINDPEIADESADLRRVNHSFTATRRNFANDGRMDYGNSIRSRSSFLHFADNSTNFRATVSSN